MSKHDQFGEFAYKRDMRRWRRQSQILRIAAGASVLGLLLLFARIIGL